MYKKNVLAEWNGLRIPYDHLSKLRPFDTKSYSIHDELHSIDKTGIPPGVTSRCQENSRDEMKWSDDE